MDKIARLRQEIERLKGICTAQIEANPGQTFPFVMEMTGYDKLLPFLDTLSEEPDKSLEEEISRTYHDGSVTDTEDIDHVAYENIARHFAKWGAEHLRDSTKMIDKSLEEAADEYSNENEYLDVGFCVEPVYIGHKTEKAFKARAEWQASQMPMPEDTVLFNKGVAEGRGLEREDMLKGAVEKTVGQCERQWGGNIHFMHGFEVDEMDFPFLNSQECGYGDKIKVIVLKDNEDESK